MKRIKYFILTFVILGGLCFIFCPEFFPENPQIKEILNSVSQNDVIIIFNSGGWGDTPLEKAEDFLPIIKGLQNTINEWGYSSVVIPYTRTKDNFLGRISSFRGTLFGFQKQAGILSDEIKEYLSENPGKKVVIAGLSNGAAFVEDTIKKVPATLKNQVLAIEVGIPFWKKKLNSENILRLTRQNQDPLSKGELKILVFTLVKTPIKWFLAKVSGKEISLSQAAYIPGHEYSWEEVRPEMISFLENKIK